MVYPLHCSDNNKVKTYSNITTDTKCTPHNVGRYDDDDNNNNKCQ